MCPPPALPFPLMLPVDSQRCAGFVAFESSAEALWELIVDMVTGTLLEGAGDTAQVMDLMLRQFVEMDSDGAGVLSTEALQQGD